MYIKQTVYTRILLKRLQQQYYIFEICICIPNGRGTFSNLKYFGSTSYLKQAPRDYIVVIIHKYYGTYYYVI